MPCSDCSPTFSALKKLKECQLRNRARFNHAPVASERTEFTELISQAEKDLVSYEETIAWLQERIVALKSEQRDLNCQVRLAKSLMAPIRQLPPELLREIFIAHGVQNIICTSRPLVPCDIPGFKVASICSHWRSVATNTTALWNDICIKINGYHTKYDSFLSPRTERLLALSQESLLSISIYISSAPRVINSIVSTLVLLCAHANRWQRLEGFIGASALRNATPIADTLASIQGRLDNLHTFDLLGPFEYCSRWVAGAPKLDTLSFRHLDHKSTTSIPLPWNQIVNFRVRGSGVPRIAAFLQKMPDLLSLRVVYFWGWGPHEDEKPEQVVARSTLKALKIIILDDDNEEQMETLFQSFTLPQLQSLCIEVEVDFDHLTSQNNRTWSSLALPSLISRSSALITSLSLGRVWMATSHLISLLQIMPALNSLLLSEFSDDEGQNMSPMINDQLLSSMHVHHHQDQQPILTRLTSLSLSVSPDASFNIPTFVKMIHSRWKPVYVDDDEILCIKTVRLFARASTIVPKTVHSLMVLRKRGLDATIEDENGVVSSESELAE